MTDRLSRETKWFSPQLSRYRPFLAAVAVCAVFALPTGCGSPQDTAAHKIADELPSAIGPATRYDVHVDGDAMAMSRGRARRVQIHGVDVQVSKTLTLDDLNLDIRDVSFDTDARKLQHIGSAEVEAAIGQRNLDAYLAASHDTVPGLTVTLRESDVQIQWVRHILVDIPATITGTLEPEESSPGKIDFIANSVHVGPIPLPAGAVNAVLSEVNPVVDLSSVKIPMEIQSVSVVNYQLQMQGTAHIP